MVRLKYPSATTALWLDANVTISTAKLEQVVSAPKNPAITNDLSHDGQVGQKGMSMPAKKQPNALATNVPVGKFWFNGSSKT